ncbi:unnamed protein product [Auanema sp. JU1783]|nr:unnamed protein product [Auanema sp. JU1783]
MTSNLEPEDNVVAQESDNKRRDSRIISNPLEGANVMVILFGWAGCRDRYLSKYAQYYEKAGFSTIRFTTPIKKVWSFASYSHFAKCFYKETFGNGSKIPDNIFFHVFSMNGCSQFATFWDHLHEVEGGDKIKQKVKGILYDSAPAFTSPSQSANAVSFASLPPPTFNSTVRNTYRVILLTFFSMHRGMIWMQSLLDGGAYEKTYAYFRMLAMDDLPKNQIFFYGPLDDVCSQESIEHFAKEMESRGVNVTRKIMKDSHHCQHFRTYADEYTTASLDFINSLSGQVNNNLD